MKRIITKIVFAVCGIALVSQVTANNLMITGTSVTGSDISFNISWDNSWNTDLAPDNWDAVWVFVKYQDCATRQWYHADLSTNSLDHTVGGLLTVDAVPDGKGVFLKRSAVGGGNIASTAVTLAMNIPAGTYNYKVFGIEMVYIPTGDFQIGDGASSNSFNILTLTAAEEHTSGVTAAALGASSATVPAAFPLGVDSIYCMKYEITQEQYVEFLNTLTYDQQVIRTTTDPISAAGTFAFNNPYSGASGYFRMGIKIMTPGNNNVLPAVYACEAGWNTVYNEVDDGQNLPCTYLSWADVAAYLDWAALRPMSEFEYEKICRGPVAGVTGEYAWGTTEISYRNVAGLSNPGRPNETFSVVNNGACVYGVSYTTWTYGPCRVGINATSSSGRASAGASYYGVMDMTGNVEEQVVGVRSTNSGVAYTGNLGDGALTTLGQANQTSWPGTTGAGSYDKGGDWSNGTAATILPVSSRLHCATPVSARERYYGGRGVR
ncbi:MAG: formylglycine-generating enzyme family protein [Bacteroidetes bacterium]|nr:formylglycine-generating enzyme family protein [Bacteroidota bacterium]